MFANGFRTLVGAGVMALAMSACGSEGDDSGEAAGGTSQTGDAGPGSGGAGGNGGGPSGVVTTWGWAALTLSKPEMDVNEVLGPLFDNALKDGSIRVLFQVDDTQASGPVVRTGSANLTGGEDTPEDPRDDTFQWRTEAECSDSTGATSPCTMDVGETGITPDDAGGFVTAEKTIIHAYSSKYKMVVRLGNVEMTATTSDCAFDVCVSFTGAVAVSDASRTIFELVTDDPTTRTDLKTFMDNFGVAPDTQSPNAEGVVEDAYTFAGNIQADEVAFLGE